ncbi:hypothetical protein MLD38_024742 [Melastoma candidum]|uniref:Uncharacterized protein n=1 Tax=Melastoma candidum TaxID=119954 RepID=A0ACB9NU66_9MYRT|nr:hypothetical protein MLD38_024742 [Melastoma candidum]
MGNRHVLSRLEIVFDTFIKFNHNKGGAPLPHRHQARGQELLSQVQHEWRRRGQLRRAEEHIRHARRQGPFWQALQAIKKAGENGDFYITGDEIFAQAEFV